MRTLLAPFAAALLAGCVTAIRPDVPAAELGLRLPQNQDGILVEGELVRATFLPAIAFGRPDAAARAAFSGIGSVPSPWIVASRSAETRSKLVFAGRPERYRRGFLHSRRDAWTALAQARARSAFHAPVKAAVGGGEVFVVHDVVPVTAQLPEGEHLLTLEVYQRDPRAAWTRGELPTPARVWVFARRGSDGSSLARPAAPLRLGTFVEVSKIELGTDGRLASVELGPWRPRVDAILGGTTAHAFLTAEDQKDAGAHLEMERLLNDTLVEWKSRRLVDWARRATPEQLDDAIVAGEKGMLELDRRSRVVKDQIDAQARSGSGGQPALTETAQLLDQRKTLVGVVIGTMKQARAALRSAAQ